MKKKPNKKEDPKKKIVIKKATDTSTAKPKEPVVSPFQMGGGPKVNVVNMTGEDVPKEIQDALNTFVESLKKSGGSFMERNGAKIGIGGVDFRKAFETGNIADIGNVIEEYIHDFNCGNPDCPVHGRKNRSKPWDEAKFKQKIEMVKNITSGKSKGFVVIAEVTGKEGNLTAVKGSDYLGGVSKQKAVASIAKAFGISRKEMHEIAEDMEGITMVKDRDEE